MTIRPLLAISLILAACGTSGPSAGPSTAGAPSGATSTPVQAEPSPPVTPASPASPGPRATGPTFLIVMENRSFSQALSGSFTSRLAAQQILITDYHAVAHPSLPNYLALTSGSTWAITDDGYHPLPTGRDLGSQLTAAGIPWRAYMDGMTGRCLQSPPPYALKHNPFAYYGGACPDQVKPLNAMAAELSGGAPPAFSFITPDLCHDGHDCSTAEADAFLESLVGRITSSSAWLGGSVLFIVWDEDDGSADNHVPLIAVTPQPAGRRVAGAFNHYSLLATIEHRLGVPRLGAAAQAAVIPDPAITT